MYMNIVKVMLSTFYVATASYYIYDKYYREKRQKRDEINEVIMFREDAQVLRKSRISRCNVTPSMERLLYYLNLPRCTLDICMGVIKNRDLITSTMHNKFLGIKVRLIIDSSMIHLHRTFLKKFENQGVEVRWMDAKNIMNHKFCLIDASSPVEVHTSTPTVICGSLAWTNEALGGNWEDVLVTSQKQLVEAYKIEFERLWNEFKPTVKHNATTA